MPTEYIEQREEDYFVRGSRVSLDSIAYGYQNGESPETIRDNFPTLSLEQIYGAIAFYLAHQSKIDSYLEAKRAAYEEARLTQHVPPDLRERMQRSRERLQNRS